MFNKSGTTGKFTNDEKLLIFELFGIKPGETPTFNNSPIRLLDKELVSSVLGELESHNQTLLTQKDLLTHLLQFAEGFQQIDDQMLDDWCPNLLEIKTVLAKLYEKDTVE